MKPTIVAGVLLVILGVTMLVYQGFTYTDTDTVVDIGPFEAQVETEETVPISPVIGGTAVVGGMLLIVAGSRARQA